MSLKLPVQASVDRSVVRQPYLIPDPDGGALDVVHGVLPGNPSPLLRPICGLVACPARRR